MPSTTLDSDFDAAADTAAALWRAANHAKESRAWSYREIETTHMVVSNRPNELAAILLETVSEASPREA